MPPVEEIKKSGELCLGGDIRKLGNAWIRAAFQDSSLQKAPREGQVRMAITRLAKKAKLRL